MAKIKWKLEKLPKQPGHTFHMVNWGGSVKKGDGYIEVTRNQKGEWNWHAKQNNGKVVCQETQGRRRWQDSVMSAAMYGPHGYRIQVIVPKPLSKERIEMNKARSSMLRK